jgi:tripartite-type tricarboxylate transporter receptor subunit TctC
VPNTWFCFGARPPPPPDIVAKINDGFNKGLHDPSVRTRMDNLGINLAGGTPQDFQRHIATEMDKWGAVVRKAGVKPQAGQ